MYITTEPADRRLREITARAHAAPIGRSASLPAEPPALRLVADSNTEEAADPAGDQQRKSRRVPIDAEVCVRRSGGFNFQVQLRDMSIGGCRVELLEPCDVDDHLIARFPKLEPMGARACWTQGTVTGLQFTTTFHPAVLDSLLKRLSGAEKPRPL
jgi:hypothetical protein